MEDEISYQKQEQVYKNALYCVYRQGAIMNYKDKIQEDDNIEKEL